MIRQINQAKGQTALILILLTAAALIFLAITLNWGRVAQTKVMLTIAADQGASLLASNMASYGEKQKQTYLGNKNQVTHATSIILVIILVIVIIIVTIVTWGQSVAYWGPAFATFLAAASITMAVVNLALQLLVVQPGITELWNKIQRNQPIPQQFFEGGVAAALQSAITDQVNITDYFDSNANGVFGRDIHNFSNDNINRFALFYTDRLNMLNQKPIPQVVFFYNQLVEFMYGETCAQNASDNKLFGVPILPVCVPLDCPDNPSNLACGVPIPNGFQLNDSCIGSDPNNTTTYSPYCDPCCQPFSLNGSALRPASCPQPPNATTCLNSPNDPSCVLPQCLVNNPYGSSFPYIYDSSFQDFANGLSFLDQFGRDQQSTPFANMTPNVLTPAGATPSVEFPNGVFPFFWYTKAYSLEVDTISPSSLGTSQVHWCAAGGSVPSIATPVGFPNLAQLTLSYSCQGPDCCVNYLANTVVSNIPFPGGSNTIDLVGSPSFPYNAPASPPLGNPGLDPSFAEGNDVSTTWLQGDNQMCLANWPYNGGNAAGPFDGTCQWTGTINPPLPLGVASPVGNMTVDSVDNTMHALSDFVTFSKTLLVSDPGTLSASFQTWYPQAAGWIAPGDSDPADPSGCTSVNPNNVPNVCNPGLDGRLLSIYNPYNGLDKLKDWNNLITNWLNDNFAGNAWCVPPGTTGSTQEDAAINAGGTWGGLSSVIACLNYNGGPTPANNYGACNAALASAASTCFYLPTPQCLSTTLGRSLAGAAPGFTPSTITCSSQASCRFTNVSCNPPVCTVAGGVTTCAAPVCTTFFTFTNPSISNVYPPTSSCVNGDAGGCISTVCAGAPIASCGGGETLSTSVSNFITPGSTASCNIQPATFAKWVNDSDILATDEAPKFSLRSAFLSDVQKQAQTMQSIFSAGDTALQNFLKPCSGTGCQTGGPAAQLVYASTLPAQGIGLPNSVIYGWQDTTPTSGSGGCTDGNGNRKGCSHIVKVTVYSTGRTGSSRAQAVLPKVLSILPWIKTSTEGFLSLVRNFTLEERDGEVYISVKRWDEDQDKSVTFSNTHKLWQFLFHNPTTGNNANAQGSGLPSECKGLNSSSIGFGLLQTPTVDGLNFSMAQPGVNDPTTLTALGNAFMLNDNPHPDGTGAIDPNSNTPDYATCLTKVNQRLCTAPESHACVWYIASRNANESVPTGNDSPDYSLKFVTCPSTLPPEDLTGGVSCS